MDRTRRAAERGSSRPKFQRLRDSHPPVAGSPLEATAPPPEAEEEGIEAAAHLTDLTCPASWYPAARMMRRRVVAHMGPTNSGKTHAALLELKAAASGVYCGPLRLLAWEVRRMLLCSG